ncbi:MAG: pyridoxal phosphate-dependent aminotransferase [Pseudomonadota bacterium]
MGPSLVAHHFERASALRASGERLFDFTAGEPDFDTPVQIAAAAHRAIDTGATRYTPVTGTEAMKAAIRQKFSRDNNLEFGVREVAASAGAKPMLAAAIQSVVGPGDDVVLAKPYWPSHVNMIRMCGARPVIVETKQASGYKLTPDCLYGALTAHTRLLILCSPSNPTGAVYTAAELEALGRVLLCHPKILIVSDDVYEHIVFPPARFSTLAAVEPRLRARTLTVGATSKSYAMTGWRVGFAGGPEGWINAIGTIFADAFGNPSAVSQAAAIEALTGDQTFLSDWRQSYQQRRDLTVRSLRKIRGLEPLVPDGTFYAWVDCSALVAGCASHNHRIGGSGDLANRLLNEARVAVVPGEGFGSTNAFRLSFAVGERELCAGLQALAEAIPSIAQGRASGARSGGEMRPNR